MSISYGDAIYPCGTIASITVAINTLNIPEDVKITGIKAAVTKSGMKDDFKPLVFANGCATLKWPGLNDGVNGYRVTVQLSTQAAKSFAWLEPESVTIVPSPEDREVVPIRLGTDATCKFILASKLVQPRIDIMDSVPRDGQTLAGLRLKLTSADGPATDYPFDASNLRGSAYLPVGHAGMRPGNYVLGGADVGKLVATGVGLKVTLNDHEAIPIFPFPLKNIPTVPKLKLLAGATPVKDIELKLVSDTATYTYKTTGIDGVALPDPDGDPILPGTYKVKCDALPEQYLLPDPCSFDIPLGTTNTFTVALVLSAWPKIRVLHSVTDKPLAGIPVKLALTAKDTVKYDLGRTGNSGYAELADGPPMPVGNYKIQLAGNSLAATLVSPLTVDIAAGVTTTVAKALPVQGVLRFIVNRADGAALTGRVKFGVALESTPLVLAASGETAAAEEEVDNLAGGKRKSRCDRVDVSLDAGIYIVTIKNIDADVTLKNPGCTLGPSKTGVAKVVIANGETNTLEYTLSPYNKIQFVGYSCRPGYQPGFRCLVCDRQAQTLGDGKCKVNGCAGDLSMKRCTLCNRRFPQADTRCTNCDANFKYYCTTCNKSSATTGKCSNAPCVAKTIVNRCESATPHNLSTGGKCPKLRGAAKVRCGKVVEPYCLTCNKFLPAIGECGTCHKGCVYVCRRCNALIDFAGVCTTHKGRALAKEQIYLGMPKDTDDLLARCLIMKQAIRTAFKKSTNVDADTLKVFVAPEFYFRGVNGAYDSALLPLISEQLREETIKDIYKDWLFVLGTAQGYLRHGTEGAKSTYKLKTGHQYTALDGTRVVHIASGDGPDGAPVTVFNRISDNNSTLPLPEQWKIKFGADETTLSMFSRCVDATNCVPPCPKAANASAEEYWVQVPAGPAIAEGAVATVEEPLATEVFNIAIVQKGGGGDGVSGLRDLIVYKEYVSSIDFLRSTDDNFHGFGGKGRNIYLHDKDVRVMPTEGSFDDNAPRSNPTAGERTKNGLGGGSIFTLDGITFSLEVCLDHLQEKAKNFYSMPADALKGMPQTQVMLIPSWGMSITKGSLTGKIGTLIFNVDGPLGSSAGKVSALGLAPKFTWIAVDGTPTVVPPPPEEDVRWVDDSKHPPVKKLRDALKVYYAQTLTKNQHKINLADTGVSDEYGWIDLFAVETIPDAEML